MADASTWIQVLVLGGLAGALGQTARTVVGLKKLNDVANAEKVDPKDLFVASRLVVSLTIGFVAGALAAIAMGIDVPTIGTEQVLGLAAAGYAGADFIEGFMTSNLPETKTTPTQTVPGQPPNLTPIAAGTTPDAEG